MTVLDEPLDGPAESLLEPICACQPSSLFVRLAPRRRHGWPSGYVAYLDDWTTGRDDADINADGVIDSRGPEAFLGI